MIIYNPDRINSLVEFYPTIDETGLFVIPLYDSPKDTRRRLYQQKGFYLNKRQGWNETSEQIIALRTIWIDSSELGVYVDKRKYCDLEKVDRLISKAFYNWQCAGSPTVFNFEDVLSEVT